MNPWLQIEKKEKEAKFLPAQRIRYPLLPSPPNNPPLPGPRCFLVRARPASHSVFNFPQSPLHTPTPTPTPPLVSSLPSFLPLLQGGGEREEEHANQEEEEEEEDERESSVEESVLSPLLLHFGVGSNASAAGQQACRPSTLLAVFPRCVWSGGLGCSFLLPFDFFLFRGRGISVLTELGLGAGWCAGGEEDHLGDVGRAQDSLREMAAPPRGPRLSGIIR